MAMQQDPSHPSGVIDTSPRGGSEVSRARSRKAHAALAMRKKRIDWEEIAETLGYADGHTALVATEKALEDGLLAPESQEFLRTLAATRLEELLDSVYTQATDTDHPDQLAYHDRATKTIKDIADLLGFKAPQEFTINNPSAARLEAWVARMQARDSVAVEEADIFETVEMTKGADGVYTTGETDAAPAE